MESSEGQSPRDEHLPAEDSAGGEDVVRDVGSDEDQAGEPVSNPETGDAAETVSSAKPAGEADQVGATQPVGEGDTGEVVSGASEKSSESDEGVEEEAEEVEAKKEAEAEAEAEEEEEEAEAEEEEAEEEEDVPHVEPIEEILEEAQDEQDIESQMDWYILKVQSNREKSICDALRRRVAVAGLDDYFADVVVPTEDVAEYKNGRRKIVKRKLYPGYIVVRMAINEETWFLVRETPGIGDFTGSAGRPTPMLPHEVDRIIKKGAKEDGEEEAIKTAIPFKQGDRVRIKDGTFENFEGDVEGIDEANGRVTVMINIFGRSTPVELEHWQVDEV
jgi:transcriptional antiterminator NusG